MGFPPGGESGRAASSSFSSSSPEGRGSRWAPAVTRSGAGREPVCVSWARSVRDKRERLGLFPAPAGGVSAGKGCWKNPVCLSLLLTSWQQLFCP